MRALEEYKEALVWFPRSAQGCLLYSRLLKSVITSQDDINLIEKLLQRAIAALDITAENHSNILPTTTAGWHDNYDKDAIAYENNILMLQNNDLILEKQAAIDAQYELAFLLCQEGRVTEANQTLWQLGFRWKLSNGILHYPIPNEEQVPSQYAVELSVATTSAKFNNNVSSNSNDADITNDISQYAHVIDDILSPKHLSHLLQIFRPSAPFWAEHHYDTLTNSSRTVGYFSYLYPCKERPAAYSIEQVIDEILPHVKRCFPGAADCVLGEI